MPKADATELAPKKSAVWPSGSAMLRRRAYDSFDRLSACYLRLLAPAPPWSKGFEQSISLVKLLSGGLGL
jgi:hypothetical protein